MKSKLFRSIMLLMAILALHVRPSPAQTSKEIYVSSSALQFGSLSFQYKTSLKNNKYFRIALVDIKSTFESDKPATSNSFSSSNFGLRGGLEIGLEKRITITERMMVFYGIDLICMSGLSRYRTNSPNLPVDSRVMSDFNISPGLGFNSGILLNIKNDFYFAAAITPHLLFEYAKHERLENSEIAADYSSGFDVDLDSESVRISLVYRWDKE